jgi:hypothetical protein
MERDFAVLTLVMGAEGALELASNGVKYAVAGGTSFAIHVMFFTVRMKSFAFPLSTKVSGLAAALNSIWFSRAVGTESANVQKGARITTPATMAAARKDVASFPRSSMLLSPFQKD